MTAPTWLTDPALTRIWRILRTRLEDERLPLTGAPVEPAWDAELGAAMRHHGIVVHEEAVLEALLDACHK